MIAAIDYFNKYAGGGVVEGGGIVLFAAGNSGNADGYDPNQRWYPAAYEGTVAVAALERERPSKATGYTS